MNLKLKIILIFILIFQNGFSQTPIENILNMQISQIKKSAKHAIRNGDLYSALDYYAYLCEKKPKNNTYKFQLAELYRQVRDYENAEIWYNKAYLSNKEKYKKALYYQAQMQKSQGKYKTSIKNFEKFAKQYRNKKDSREFKHLTKTAIEGSKLAILSKSEKPNVLIQHLDASINKAHIEASPFYVDENTVNLVSMRIDKVEYYNLKDTNTVLPKQNFHVIKKEGGNWKYFDELDYPAKTEVNVSSGVYSSDSKRFYFTKCTKNWKNKMICKIFLSKKTKNGWTDAELLKGPINDPKYTATQPAIGINSKDGKEVLYFVSDRPGGKGGLDIWYSVYKESKGCFYKVKNAGSKINTIADEITPYYNSKMHTLYFSSNYWSGYGGFDIFKIYGELKKWDGLGNMAKGINSSADDIYFTLAPNRESGILASNREGGVSLKNKTCCDDLYEINFTNFIKLTAEGRLLGLKDSLFYKMLLEENLITQLTIDTSENPTLLDKFPVRLYMINKETGSKVLVAVDSTSLGHFSFDLEHDKDYEIEIISKKKKYIRNLSTRNITSSKNISIDDIMIDIIPNEPIILDNIYYKFDKAELTQIAKNTIDTTILDILKKYPNILVEILSHTDSKGEDDYNINLSQARAESVVQYLILKGIESARLVANGYGETKPIAPNTDTDGFDNPKGRAKNRRTDFRIIGTIDKEIFYNNDD